MKDLKLQYLGFLNTPNLWLETSGFDMQQFEIANTISDVSNLENNKLRLGNLVERFVYNQLKQDLSSTRLLLLSD